MVYWDDGGGGAGNEARVYRRVRRGIVRRGKIYFKLKILLINLVVVVVVVILGLGGGALERTFGSAGPQYFLAS